MSLKTPESSLPHSHVLERGKQLRSTFSHILRAVFLKILGITSAITQIWALTWNSVILVSWPRERPSVTLGLQVSDGSFRNRVWSLRKHQRKLCQVKQNRALCLSNLCFPEASEFALVWACNHQCCGDDRGDRSTISSWTKVDSWSVETIR